MIRYLSKICLGICLLAVTYLSGPSAHAQLEPSIEVRTINGLTQRRLFDVATTYAETLLVSGQLDGRATVDITVALLDTLAKKAYQSSDPADWDNARKKAVTWEATNQSPRKILISVQAALLEQLQIERWIRELELKLAGAETKALAVEAISNLVNRFSALQADIKTLLNRRPSPREEAEWFTANELLTLRYNIEYQRARTLLYRAALYNDAEDLNRNDVLTMVEGQLKSVLQSMSPSLPLWWTVQADRIALARKMRDYQSAYRLYSSLPTSAATVASRNEVNAEWIRTLIETKKYDDAIAIAGKESFASKSAKLDLARVELFVAMLGAESGEIWQQRALELTKSIEQNHGGYWGRLANLAVVGTAAGSPESGSSLDLLIRVADEAQRNKQWEEAIIALDAAYAQADKSKSNDIAWKLGFRAASIEQSLNRYANAQARFEKLATQHADLADAHTGYLMACWNLTRTMTNQPEELTRYEAMLSKLIETWPASSSADQARIWLAGLRKSQKNRPAAIGLLLDVNAASPLFGKAVSELSSVSTRLMKQGDLSEESKSNIRSALIVRLLPLLDVTADAMPDNWQETQTKILVLLMELKILYDAELPQDLDKNFQRLLKDPAIPAETRLLANALEYVRRDFAFEMAQTQAGRARQLAIIREGLTTTAEDPEFSKKAPRLLKAFQQLANDISELPQGEQNRWNNAALDALVSQGDLPNAVNLAATLAEANPRDAATQIRLAKLLTRQSKISPEIGEQALKQWRKVARSSRKQSQTWFTAKYFVAKLLGSQGKQGDALKLLNFIKAVPPGWKQAENASDFDALYRSLKDSE